MTQSRETRDQLWRVLLTRSVMTPRRVAVPWFVIVPLAALLTAFALYLFSQL